MQGFISIIAASAVLSAGLAAGLAAADATPSAADRLPVAAPASAGWVDPPARGAPKAAVRISVEPGAGCAAAWPYRSAACAEAPARKVRVIAVEGQADGRPSAGSIALALR